MDIGDLFDGIGDLFTSLADEIADAANTVVDEMQKIETVAEIVGEGIADAADVVGDGVVTLGTDVARFAESTCIGLIDLANSSALELADFAENAAGEIAHFSEHAFDTVRDELEKVVIAVGDFLAAMFTETLPELDGPSDDARTIAQLVLLGQYFTSEQLCRSAGFTVLHGLKIAGGPASATAGVYVSEIDGQARWGFFKGYKLDDFAGFVPGVSVDVEITLYYGDRGDASGADVIALKAGAKIGPLTVEGKALFAAKWPPSPVGCGFSAGLSLGPGDDKPGNDAKKQRKGPRLRLQPEGGGAPVEVDARDAYNAGRQIVNSADAAARAALSPGRADRARATAQIAALGSSVFSPAGYGRLALALGEPATAAYVALGDPVAGDPSRRHARVDAAIAADLRVRPGLADPTRLSFEVPGPTPLYLEARDDGTVVFSPPVADAAWRDRCTYVRLPLAGDETRTLLQPLGKPRVLWRDADVAGGPLVQRDFPVAGAPTPDQTRGLFRFAAAAVPRRQTATLLPEHALAVGEHRRAPDGEYFVTLQADGRLAVCRGVDPGAPHEVLWTSGPVAATGPFFAQLDTRGRLGVYKTSDADATAPLWQTPSVAPKPPHPWPATWFAAITDHGTLAVFAGEPERPDALIWDSDSGEARPWPLAERSVVLRAGTGGLVGGFTVGDAAVATPAVARTHVSPLEVLTLVELSDGSVAVRNAKHQYLGVYSGTASDAPPSLAAGSPGATIDAAAGVLHLTSRFRAAERFTLVRHAGAAVSLRACNGRFVCHVPGNADARGLAATAAGADVPEARFELLELAVDPIAACDRAWSLVSAHAGRAIEPQGGGHRRHVPFVLADVDPVREGQRFRLSHVRDGEFAIINERSEQALTVLNASTQPGGELITYPWYDNVNQRFYLRPHPDGSFSLIVRHSGLAVDLAAGATASGTRLVQSAASGVASQRFELHPQPPRSINAIAMKLVPVWGDRNYIGSVYARLDGREKQLIGGPGGDLRKSNIAITERPLADLRLVSRGHQGESVVTVAAEGHDLPIGGYTADGYSFALTVPAEASSEDRDRARDLHLCYQLYLEDRGLTDVHVDGERIAVGSGVVEGIRIWAVERIPRIIDARRRIRGATADLAGRVVMLRNRASGKVLQLAGGPAYNGPVFTQGDPVGADHQKFWLCRFATRDLFMLLVDHNKHNLSVQDASDDRGRPVITWQLGGGDNQLFAIIPDPELPNTYFIAAENSRRFLTTNGSTQTGAPIVQDDVAAPRIDTFRWELIDAAPGPSPWPAALLDIAEVRHTLTRRYGAMPVTGRGSIHRSDGAGALSQVGAEASLPWSVQAIPGHFNGPTGAHDLLLYDPASGAGSFHAGQPTGELTAIGAPHTGWRRTWRIIPGKFSISACTDLLFYDPATGQGVFHMTDGAGNLHAFGNTHVGWRRTWQIVPGKFSGNGLTDLLFYDPAAGEAWFCRVDASANIVQIGSTRAGLRRTWQIVPGKFTPGAYTDLLFYDPATGEAAFHRTDGNGGLVQVGATLTGWRRTWQIVPGKFTPGEYTDLLLYDSVTGDAVFYRTDGAGNITPIRSHTGWRKTWRITAGNFTSSGFSDLFMFDAAP